MEELDDTCDPLIDFEEFYQFHLKYPKVLWPVFRMQHRLRYQTLGVEFWKNHCHLLFGLRQTRTVNQVAVTNAARAEQFEAAIEASRDPDTGAIRVPISVRGTDGVSRRANVFVGLFVCLSVVCWGFSYRCATESAYRSNLSARGVVSLLARRHAASRRCRVRCSSRRPSIGRATLPRRTSA